MAQSSNAVSDAIKYLLDRKFPYFRDSAAFQMRMLPRPAMDGATANLLIEKYRTELHTKWPEELLALVRAEQEVERQELAFYESLQWFSVGCEADFDFWCKAAFWSVEEAMALTLGKEPRRVTWDSVKAEERFSPLVKEFKQRLELGRRAEVSEQLPRRHCSPLTFLTWAKEVNLSYPSELEVVIERSSAMRTDWKTKYEEEAAAHYATKAEVQTLRSKTAEWTEKPGWLRERDSLLKLAIGMAIKGYGYSPTAHRNVAVPEIAGDLLQLEIALSEDTIRKYLKQGTLAIPDFQTERTERAGSSVKP